MFRYEGLYTYSKQDCLVKLMSQVDESIAVPGMNCNVTYLVIYDTISQRYSEYSCLHRSLSDPKTSMTTTTTITTLAVIIYAYLIIYTGSLHSIVCSTFVFDLSIILQLNISFCFSFICFCFYLLLFYAYCVLF